MGQKKVFYKQRMSEYTYAREETVAIDILITSRNRDRKIMEPMK